MGARYTGRCLCGAIRYESDAEQPALAGNCHCRDCQRSSGAAAVPALFLPRDSLTISGDVRWYEIAADSGNRFSRGFCPTCGSGLFGTSTGLPAVIGVRAGTLDDPDLYEPVVDIFVSSAPRWHVMNDDLPKFTRGPAPPRQPEP